MITPQRNTLITCGGCDGYCETRSLTNISHDVMRYNSTNGQSVVTTGDVPTVGAVVLGAEFEHRAEGTSEPKTFTYSQGSVVAELLLLQNTVSCRLA